MLSWRMEGKVVGQDRAVRTLVKALGKYEVKMHDPHKPIAVLLFMGPTGVGKTETVRALAEILLNNRDAFTKVDCGEYQSDHEISKLIGSPPGYIGYKEINKGTPGRLSQEAIDKWSVDKNISSAPRKPNIILFDEIEKADSALFDILLGGFDEGRMTMGNGEIVDLTRSIIIMTSNLGSTESAKLVTGASIGFHRRAELTSEDLDQKLYENAKRITEKFFRIEFLNRVDKMIVFRSLTEEHILKITDLELTKVQRRINLAPRYIPIRPSKEAKQFLAREGFSKKWGARELKRTIERYVTTPVANLLATNDLKTGDVLFINYNAEEKGLVFETTYDPIDYVAQLPPDLVVR